MPAREKTGSVIPELDVAALFQEAGCDCEELDRRICETACNVGFMTIVGVPMRDATGPDARRSLLRLVHALREVSRDRLVFVVAHRLSTIRSADEILFLDEGEIRERGSRAELMALDGGAYRRFVELQGSVAA